MSLIKNKNEIIKLDLTDSQVIEMAEQDFVYITRYPSIKFYNDWIKAIVESQSENIDELAKSILKDEAGQPLLKTSDDVIQHDVYEHILTRITEYLVKSKTKISTQTAPLESNSI
jgi:hypothetical protein